MKIVVIKDKTGAELSRVGLSAIKDKLLQWLTYFGAEIRTEQEAKEYINQNTIEI